MEFTYKIMLGLHIVSGVLALLNGLLAVISKKGGKLHRFSGKVFFFSMLGVCTTAIYISILRDNQFLLFIGVFSFYLNYSGYMALKNKSLKPKVGDWLVLIAAAVNAFFMIYSMNMVLMIFGLLCIYIVLQNLRSNILVLKNNELPDKTWLKRHIGMMMGAFISTCTAFLVVNTNSIESLPQWLVWLIPSIILSPVSVYFSKKYAGKRSSKKLKQSLSNYKA